MLSDLLKWGRRAGPGPADISPPKGADTIVASKAFPKFLSALKNQPEPSVVIDLGPVIGSNVAFLGERLDCKLFIEDLVSELDKYKKSGGTEGFQAAMAARLRHGEGAVDGVLCWDFFDFLEKPAALALATHIKRMLRPGGAVMGFFSTAAVERAPFSKFEIADEQSVRRRHHPGAGGPKYPLLNRDIIKMFEGLVVSDSFLLKSNTREILLRKR
ncbi:MAG: class I SAM-dependent methyltransferase [Vicinamibacterales bacterium]